MPRKEGEFFAEDYYVLNGGLNTADSPFLLDASMCTGGKNFDFRKRGGVQKRYGHPKLNSSANTQTKSIGIGLWDRTGGSRLAIRAAGTKLQNFDTSAYTFQNLSEDTAPSGSATVTITVASPGVLTSTAHGLSVGEPVQLTTTGALPTGLTASTTYYVLTVPTANTFTLSTAFGGAAINTSGTQSGTHTLKTFNTAFLNGASTQPTVFSMFNRTSAGVLWGAGGGMASASLYGAYSSSKVTKNGVPAPGGSISLSTTASTTGDQFSATGFYRYAIAFRKTSTQAIGNAALFKEVHVTTATDDVTIDLSSVTGIDTTKYDKFVVYRSAVSSSSQIVNGVTPAFTTGDLVALVSISASSYVDTGTYSSTAEAVPQAGSTILDNSTPAAGTYNCVATFKRRLVSAYGNVVCFSDINKDESWPTYQTITIPSGGDITGLAIISFTSPVSSDVDEILCVFQQRGLWTITGDGILDSLNIPNWALKYISSTGAPNQSTIVAANGYLAWVNYRGVHLWNGNGKPVYISKRIEDKFGLSGDIDKSKLGQAWGMYTEGRGEIQWALSSKTYGTQKYILRLDLQSTLQGRGTNAIGDPLIEGVFSPDVLPFSAYAGMSVLTSASATEETVYYGDDAGFIYSGYTGTQDGTNYVDFEYATPYLNLAQNAAFRVHKVVAWVLDHGQYSLQLNYWSQFKYSTSDSDSRSQSISPYTSTTTGAVFGVGTHWGTGTKFGRSGSQPRPVVFNLSGNNAEGDVIRLQFSQYSSTKQCVFYGFSVYYSPLALRK